MALQKTPIPINFAKGLETKADPYQVGPASFLSLTNSVFTTTGRLTKRNGFKALTKLPTTSQTTLTTLRDNLIATGTELYAYNQQDNQWLDQGITQPVSISALPLLRSATSQTSPDAAVSPQGLICTVYMEGSQAYYQVSDSVTAQKILGRQALPTGALNPRAFLLGQYFIITYAIATPSPRLMFVAISIANPSMVSTPTVIASTLSSASAGYDGCVGGNVLYVGYGGTGSTFRYAVITSALTAAEVHSTSSTDVSLVSVTVDPMNAYVWFTYWGSSSTAVNTLCYTTQNIFVSTSTNYKVGSILNGLTSIASASSLMVYMDNANTYTYSPNAPTDFIDTATVTLAGGVTAHSAIIRSVGLGSKAFLAADGKTYMLVEYGATNQANSLNNSNQPSYFLMNGSGQILGRLAYSNAGGYAQTQVLPSVSYLNGTYMVPYQYVDSLTTVNKGTGLSGSQPVNAIFTQTGINLATITLANVQQYSSEIAGSLHLTGGQMWQYDGIKPVEEGFQVWPENIAATTSTSVTTTGRVTSGSTQVFVTTSANIGVGMTITDTTNAYIPAGTKVTGINGNVLTISANATGTSTPDNLTFTGNMTAQQYFYQFTYEWTDGQGNLQRSAPSIPISITTTGSASSVTINVPTLRLTYKTGDNAVRIVGYRWSVAQQVYYQFTSVMNPVINDTTLDSVQIVDANSDAQILGNAIIYTTGSVIENIAPPASVATALFNNRLFLIDAEDRNLLWFSKQIIEATPVEMSDLLTLYVAPTTGVQGSTGDMTALSAMDDKLIIFKKDAIYYITGSGPDNTGANSQFSDPIFITSSVGCDNPRSIVLTPQGLMFQSGKGIWRLGRDLSTSYVGDRVEKYNNNVVRSAQVIPGTNQARFILDNGLTLMYDYYFNEWATHTNVLAISSTLYQDAFVYLNSVGQVLQETQGVYTDNSVPVLMSFTTAWISLSGLQGFERFYFANLLGTYLTPFKLQVGMAYNFNASALQAITVTPDNYGGSWGSEALWGSGQEWGGSEGNVFTARLFPSTQKCQSFQLSVQELYDPSYGTQPGAGLTLSGLSLIAGVKRGFRTQSAKKSFG